MRDIILKSKRINLELTRGIKLISTMPDSRLDKKITRTVAVKFNSSCVYNNDASDEIHTLFGFTYNRSKFYVGWEYRSITRDIELKTCWEYFNKDTKTKQQGSSYAGRITIGQLYFITISLDLVKFKAEVSIKNQILANYPLCSSVIIDSGQLTEYGLSFSLGPRLGKIKVRPESKMSIKLKDI